MSTRSIPFDARCQEEYLPVPREGSLVPRVAVLVPLPSM
ncbi:hypothetical protein D187_006935 [Cystobacter fuscus DSM 2262]|uniref:Uncharacterized protein n=1 Tax=Cystobacter fuscus (strain ATCC 25194 / DSM 2262 / NBRC 100088 / M29) TaxID=1242864 RepID=S9P239_CYSF2|nr:hypothetical protein D187_006935 [Cystobacter fuscus DSM 2262]